MSKTADVSKDLTESKTPQSTLHQLIEKSAKELGKALPKSMSPERLVRIALTSIRLNPKLAECTPQSFLGSLFTLAQLGMEPVAGRAYLIPFNNSRKINGSWVKVLEVQVVIGYKGLADFFYRHARAVDLNWGAVHEKDSFDYTYGTDPFLKHKPAEGDRGPVIGYYVVATLTSGGKAFKYMTAEDCMAHGRKHSKTYDKKTGEFYKDSPWNKEPQSMCLKTVLIQLSKVLPQSVEMAQVIAADETSRHYRQGIDPLDVTPDKWDDSKEAKPEEEGEGGLPVDDKKAGA